MTEQSRAAALADKFKNWTVGSHIALSDGEHRIIVRALCLLAEPPDASAEVRERVTDAVLDPIREIVTLCCSDDIDWVERSDGLTVADAALSAIRPGDRLPAGVVVPEEPTDAMIEAAFRCPEYAIVAEGDGRMAAILRAAISAAKETTR